MVMKTVEKVLTNLGAADIDTRLEDMLIDGILSTFQEPVGTGYVGDNTWVGTWGVGMVMETVEKMLTNLGDADIDARLEDQLKWRLNNKSAKVRQWAADLIARIAVVMKACGEEQLMGHLGVVLYEYLGEARIAVVMKACGKEQLMGHLGIVLYDEYLGEGVLRAIVNVIRMTKMTPSSGNLNSA
ncbi:unnamed protein product [Closterium sp. Naga37s-1]|nr:unnamed protein product [Closterium sp. Naga37s-1]